MKNIYIYIFTLIVVLLPLPGRAGELDISYSSMESTVDSYATSARVSDQAGPLDFYAEYHYGKTDDIVIADDGEVSVGYDPIVSERVSLWFDERARFNKMIGVRFENFVGFGPKYYVLKDDKRKLSLSTGILYHYRADDEEGDGRYSHRIKYDDVWISGVYFYQPNIRDSSDYITEGELKIKIREGLSVFYREEYRSVGGFDRVIERGVVFDFHFDFKEVK